MDGTGDVSGAYTLGRCATLWQRGSAQQVAKPMMTQACLGPLALGWPLTALDLQQFLAWSLEALGHLLQWPMGVSGAALPQKVRGRVRLARLALARVALAPEALARRPLAERADSGRESRECI